MLLVYFEEFFNLLNGVKVIVTEDNIGTPECVDLVELWSKSLGGPRFWGNAQDIYNQPGNFYEKIANTPTNTVIKGDIVVFSSKYNGTVGHVVIAVGEGNVMKFKAFGQNDPVGSDCHIEEYSYNGPDGKPWVIGWLRRK